MRSGGVPLCIVAGARLASSDLASACRRCLSGRCRRSCTDTEEAHAGNVVAESVGACAVVACSACSRNCLRSGEVRRGPLPIPARRLVPATAPERVCRPSDDTFQLSVSGWTTGRQPVRGTCRRLPASRSCRRAAHASGRSRSRRCCGTSRGSPACRRRRSRPTCRRCE